MKKRAGGEVVAGFYCFCLYNPTSQRPARPSHPHTGLSMWHACGIGLKLEPRWEYDESGRSIASN
jgi:hypothetical protein